MILALTGCSAETVSVEDYNSILKKQEQYKDTIEKNQDEYEKLEEEKKKLQDNCQEYESLYKQKELIVRNLTEENEKTKEEIENVKLQNKDIEDKYNNIKNILSVICNKQLFFDQLTELEKTNYTEISTSIGDLQPYEINLWDFDGQSGEIIYDFNSDKKLDTLFFFLERHKGDYEYIGVSKCYILVNGYMVEYDKMDDYYSNSISAIGIMDIDVNDNFIEFYITQGDMANSVRNTIYRLSDNGIEEMSSFTGGIRGLSGDGKIYYWGGNLYEKYDDVFDTDLVISYYDIYQNDYVYTDQIIGKTIIADYNIIVYKSAEDVICDGPVTYEDKLRMAEGKIITILQDSDKFEVLSIEDQTKIRIEDGRVGWIGGLHMVWD